MGTNCREGTDKEKNELEEVSIIIGDTLDYKIIYSDLEIEEEF